MRAQTAFALIFPAMITSKYSVVLGGVYVSF